MPRWELLKKPCNTGIAALLPAIWNSNGY